MANPHRGEVELKAGDQTYTLVFTINAVCELEGALNKGINEIVADMARVSTIRAVLWAGLQELHPMDLKAAGAIMHEAGAAATAEAVNRAMSLAFPPKDATKNPQ
jgi:hypothetical protein